MYDLVLKIKQLSAHAQNHVSIERCRTSFTTIVLGDAIFSATSGEASDVYVNACRSLTVAIVFVLLRATDDASSTNSAHVANLGLADIYLNTCIYTAAHRAHTASSSDTAADFWRTESSCIHSAAVHHRGGHPRQRVYM